MYEKDTNVNSTIFFDLIQSTPDRLGNSPGETKITPEVNIFYAIIYRLTIITIYALKTPVPLQLH